MATNQVLIMFGIITVIGLLGLLVFLSYILKLSQRYIAYTKQLKKTGNYEEWVSEHKGLVTFEKISLYVSMIAAVAAIVFFVGIRMFANSDPSINASPNVFVTTAGVLVYLLIPFLFISSFINVQLYKKVPKEWQ